MTQQHLDDYAGWQGIQPLSPADMKRTFDHEDLWQRRFRALRTSPNEQDRIKKGKFRFVNSLVIETGAIAGLYELTEEMTEALVRSGFDSLRGRRKKGVDPHISNLISTFRQRNLKGVDYLLNVLADHTQAHSKILDFVLEDRPITKYAIRGLHQLIIAHQETYDADDSLGKRVIRKMEPGAFRMFPAYPNNPTQPDGTTIPYVPYEQIDSQLDRLLELYGDYRKTCHPLLVGAWLHHRFAQIHPFPDGNGRTGRMLLNWHLWSADWNPVSVHRRDRDNYLVG
ncbi:MAG: Fic family protein [Caldilineaceae bacterium SB0661_bin_34]|nr:Fic family protein [Caldilineaceae bacterium SB0661_bin_34]